MNQKKAVLVVAIAKIEVLNMEKLQSVRICLAQNQSARVFTTQCANVHMCIKRRVGGEGEYLNSTPSDSGHCNATKGDSIERVVWRVWLDVNTALRVGAVDVMDRHVLNCHSAARDHRHPIAIRSRDIRLRYSSIAHIAKIYAVTACLLDLHTFDRDL